VRCSASAEIPSFWVANSQHAMNHTVSGVRVRSNIVPAVGEVRAPQPRHISRPSPSCHAPTSPHAAHTKPSDQFSHSKQSKQSSSVPNHAENSPSDRG
jgi:hypothetical protein